MNVLHVLYLLLFFCLPFSLEGFVGNAGINIPSEPIQVLIAVLLLLTWKEVFSSVKTFFHHPLFFFVTLYILWSWISCFYSARPMVSAKYTLIETLHVIVFVVGFASAYKRYPNLLIECLLAYSITFIPLLIRGWYLAAHYNFAIDFSAAAMRPFYRDHPYYGIVISFLIPLWMYLVTAIQKPARKWFSAIILIVLGLGLFLSFSRAAWLASFISIIFTAIIYKKKGNLSKLITSIALTGTGFIIISALLIIGAQKKDFVKNTTIGNQFLSTFNWSYDIANLERLNRYKCAIRMFKEKPLTGFGNNMYKYSYQSYQKEEEKTRISVDEAFSVVRLGKGGNSHSDYLAAITELGLVGFIFWCGIVFSSLFFSLRFYLNDNSLVYLFIFCSLLTFFLQVAVNNFIHDDKISGFVWACCGVLLAAGNCSTKKLEPLTS